MTAAWHAGFCCLWIGAGLGMLALGNPLGFVFLGVGVLRVAIAVVDLKWRDYD